MADSRRLLDIDIYLWTTLLCSILGSEHGAVDPTCSEVRSKVRPLKKKNCILIGSKVVSRLNTFVSGVFGALPTLIVHREISISAFDSQSRSIILD